MELNFSQFLISQNDDSRMPRNLGGTPMRKSLLSLILLLVVVPIALCGTDPFVGTWKLNLEKSKDASDRPRLPKSETIVVEGRDDGLKVTYDLISARGEPVHFEYSAKYDGKEYPETGTTHADAVQMKRISANENIVTNKKDGKVVEIITCVISKDGKTRTNSMQGNDANGNPVTWTLVLDKQ
ncbi:MAG: hypothetical protein WCC21_04855 [Candidatus Acidiferrales bacterium]